MTNYEKKPVKQLNSLKNEGIQALTTLTITCAMNN